MAGSARSPSPREWIGPRHVQTLAASHFTIRDRACESAAEVARAAISAAIGADEPGLFKPMVQEMGPASRQRPGRVVVQRPRLGRRERRPWWPVLS